MVRWLQLVDQRPGRCWLGLHCTHHRHTLQLGTGTSWPQYGILTSTSPHPSSQWKYDIVIQSLAPLLLPADHVFLEWSLIITNGEGGRNIDIGLTAGSGFTHTSIHHSRGHVITLPGHKNYNEEKVTPIIMEIHGKSDRKSYVNGYCNDKGEKVTAHSNSYVMQMLEVEPAPSHYLLLLCNIYII